MASQTVRNAVEYLLGYLSTEEQAIPEAVDGGVVCYPGRISSALRSINGAMQEVFTKGALHQARREFGLLIMAPVTIRLEVVAGVATAPFPVSDWADWMIGCTCAIDGESDDNRIIDYDPVTETLTLINPYSGIAPGSRSVRVWHDSLSVDDMAGEIHTAEIRGLGKLTPTNNPFDLAAVFLDDQDYGHHRERTHLLARQERSSNHTGDPLRFFVDSFHRPNRSPERRLRIFPLPDRQRTLNYRARVIPPVFTESDVFTLQPLRLGLNGFTLEWVAADSRYEADGSSQRVEVVGDRWAIVEYAVFPAIPFALGPLASDSPEGSYSRISNGQISEVTLSGTGTFSSSRLPETVIPIQNDWIESIFLPIAAQRFQASPFFRNDSVTAEIARQYELAYELLSDSNPHTINTNRIRPLY